MAEKTFDLLLRLRGDTTDVSRIKDAVGEVVDKVNQIKQAGSGAEIFGAAVGTGLAAAAIAGVALYTHISNAVQSEIRLNQETLRQEQTLDRVNNSMMRIAENARDLGDQIKIGDKAELELAKLSAKMAEFREQEVNAFTSWGNTIEAIIRGALNADTRALGLGAMVSDKTFEQQEAAKQVELTQQRVDALVRSTVANLINARDATVQWANASADPAKAIVTINEQLGKATDTANKAFEVLKANPTQTNLDAYNTATERQNTLTHQLKDAQGMITEETGKEASNQSAITEAMREQTNLLAMIRGQQQLISGNSSLLPDQKNAQLFPLITQEINAMNAQLQRDVELQRSAADPAQWQQLQGRIIQARIEIARLAQEQQKMSFRGGVLADLTSWVSSFGTTAHQVGQTIQQTIGAALQSVNQWILTGKFNLQDLLRQLAQIGLQFLEQMLLQRAMMAINAAFGISQAAVTGPAVAAAWAPAATMVSIATEGQADVTAPAGVAAALAAIQSMVFANSGYFVPGRGNTDSQMAMLTPGEGVIRAPVVAAHGGEAWVNAMNSGAMPRYNSGAFIRGSGSSGSRGGMSDRIEIHVWRDENEAHQRWAQSSAGRKVLRKLKL